MAETVHLYLKANGNEVVGQSSQHSLEREGSIECLSVELEFDSERDPSSGMAIGRRRYKPLKVRKRIDASSPLLCKALVENQNIEGTFKFFRPDPHGDGQTEQFYTIEIKNGRLLAIRQISEVALGGSAQPPMEEISFVFHDIVWTYMPTGVTSVDSWSHNR